MLSPSPRDGVLTTLHSPRGSYDIEREIGKGTHSIVFLAKSRSNTTENKLVALKRLDRRKISSDLFNMVKKEAEFLQRLVHPNIVLLQEVFDDGPYLCIVLDYYSGGDLLFRVNNGGNIPECRIKQYTKQIATGLRFAHNNGIIHRDIKLENILLDETGTVVVICDWGYATNYKEGRRQIGAVGSPHYAAPELHRGDPYEGPEIDSWALGVVIYAMVFRSLPWKTHNTNTNTNNSKEEALRKVKRLILTVDYPIPENTDPLLIDLITRLLKHEQTLRLNMQEILDHGWLDECYKRD